MLGTSELIYKSVKMTWRWYANIKTTNLTTNFLSKTRFFYPLSYLSLSNKVYFFNKEHTSSLFLLHADGFFKRCDLTK